MQDNHTYLIVSSVIAGSVKSATKQPLAYSTTARKDNFPIALFIQVIIIGMLENTWYVAPGVKKGSFTEPEKISKKNKKG